MNETQITEDTPTIEITLPACPFCGGRKVKTYASRKRGTIRYYSCAVCHKTFRARVLNPRESNL